MGSATMKLYVILIGLLCLSFTSLGRNVNNNLRPVLIRENVETEKLFEGDGTIPTEATKKVGLIHESEITDLDGKFKIANTYDTDGEDAKEDIGENEKYDEERDEADGKYENSENDLCVPEGKWFKTCEKENRKCELSTKKPYAHCTDCKDGFVKRKTFWSEECVEHCSPRTSSAQECKRLDRNCYITKQNPFYECRCTHKLIEVNGKCVDPCEEGHGDGYKECNAIGRVCKFDESKEKGYSCGCKEGLIEIEENNCRDPCEEGRGDGYKECNIRGKVCKFDKSKEKGYRCGDCKEGLIEIYENICGDPCEEGHGDGYKECNIRGRVCKFDHSEENGYTCGDCKSGLIDTGENNCRDPCEEGHGDGYKECNAIRRVCKFDESKEKGYTCGDCKEGLIEVDENNCTGICDRNSAGGTKCKNMNRKCGLTRKFPFYQCGGCEEGLLEFNGLCLKEKNVKEIGPLQLLLVKSRKITEENHVLLYRPNANLTLLHYPSLLDLK